MKIKNYVILMLVGLLSLSNAIAQGTDLLSAKRNVIPGGYNFWVYTPEDYYYTQESTPSVLFLHGASLCGHDLNRALRYGTVAAIKMGRQVPALVITPQNPGGPWNPKKLNDILEWLDKNDYAYDHNRVYVLGMSLGGYGTLDFVGTYPEKVAAAMALCGGCTLKDQSRMGEAPLWIIHGTADKAVSVRESYEAGRHHRPPALRLAAWCLARSLGTLFLHLQNLRMALLTLPARPRPSRQPRHRHHPGRPQPGIPRHGKARGAVRDGISAYT